MIYIQPLTRQLIDRNDVTAIFPNQMYVIATVTSNKDEFKPFCPNFVKLISTDQIQLQCNLE